MKPMRPHFAVFSLLFFGISSAFSQTGSPQTTIQDPRAKQACAAVEQVELPAADHPTAAEEKALAGCASVDLYYGLGMAADPVKARKCAYAEMDRGTKPGLTGKAILAMIYANAKGVERNYDFAIKMACTIGDSPGDGAGRVYQLLRLKKENPAETRYSVCDHSSGRNLYEQCAILQARFDKSDRDQQLEKLTASWGARDKKAFHAFWEEEERFAKVEANNAVDLGGTFEIQEEVFVINNMVEALEKFEKGELPKHSAEEAHSAQAAEAAAFEKTQTGATSEWGTATRASVKTSEEEWRRYRTAWLAFSKQKYPGVSEDSWKTWLDQERADMLTKLTH
jgi:hypothetical protein